MSWADAKADADRWLGSLNVKRPPPGETLDLRRHAVTLPFTGRYRLMVINALARLLKKRRIEAVLPD